MASNHFGDILRISLFGESHGPCVGALLDGVPPGISIHTDEIRQALLLRKTGSGPHISGRQEEDETEFLSGIRNGKTTGGSVCFIIRNSGHTPETYESVENYYRPSHADYTFHLKYGTEIPAGRDRASGRITAPLVVAGVIARAILSPEHISFISWVSGIGTISSEKIAGTNDVIAIRNNPWRFYGDVPDDEISEYLDNISAAGDSCGGTVSCRITNCPAGLGDPVFDKLQMKLAAAMMFIPSLKAFEYGSGFRAAMMKGSEHNDCFVSEKGKIKTLTNHSGGIQGGISNGEDIFFRVGIKPVPSVSLRQKTTDRQGNAAEINIKGQHDSFHIPRVVPVVESLAALVIADAYLKKGCYE